MWVNVFRGVNGLCGVVVVGSKCGVKCEVDELGNLELIALVDEYLLRRNVVWVDESG